MASGQVLSFPPLIGGVASDGTMNIAASLQEGCSRCGQAWKVGDKVTHEELGTVVYAYHSDPEQCGSTKS